MMVGKALQGADFGRSVGHWFGPNNVAQAIKYIYF